MSADAGADIRKDLNRANEAMEFFRYGLGIYQGHVARYEFELAEAERAKLHAHLDDYLDNFAAAQKRLEGERNV